MTFKQGDVAYTLKGEWVEVIEAYFHEVGTIARYLVAPTGGTLTSWHEAELFHREELVANCVRRITALNNRINNCEVNISYLDGSRKYVLNNYIHEIAELFALIDGYDGSITDLEDTLKRVGFDIENLVFAVPPPLFVTTDV